MADKFKPDPDEFKPDPDDDQSGVSRRDLLKGGAGAAALGALAGAENAHAADAEQAGESTTEAPFPASRTEPPDRPYNLVLFISDEEAYHVRPAEGFSTPAREELQRRGTTFHNHYIGTAMCTPSRGVMFSGQPPQVNGIYDQMELGYIPSLATDKPSMGTILKQLGYETAYFGKFELRKDIITPKDSVNYTDALRRYGFDTFAPDGDKVGGPDQAYDTDTYTGSEAIRWLRTNAQELNQQGKPWCLVVSFVSPHDIMYADTNQPGKTTQVSEVGMTLTPPPDNSHFATQWKFPESPSHSQPMDSPGRPRAQLVYRIGWSAFLGDIPVNAKPMWNTYYNYYLNLIRDNDRNLQAVIDALSALDLWDSTVVMRTADHGELGGSHGGLRGKGPLPYEQETHVPAVIVHPEHAGGRNCSALTSHIDLIPTLAGLTNADASLAESALANLPGHDFSSLLEAPETAAANAIRDAVLFNYVGLQTVDAVYMARVSGDIAHGRFAPPFTEAKPDMTGRGFISFVFDGRYKFARYYAPDDFNTPETLEALLAHNEIELFDLQTDPDEINNLGVDVETHKDLILRMNTLLNRMIANEVGVNDGSFLPETLRAG
ncbi:MAG: sulfatase-like hydrolase/transferase [Hyphomicrobiales bacterium]|nr:sulfatase-like hydrolase/transferase [Hyphomicrobiales bacterium]